MSHAAYVVLYIATGMATLVADRMRTSRRSLGVAVAVALVLFAGLRGDSVDYQGYLDNWDNLLLLDTPYPLRAVIAKDIWFSIMIDVIQRLGGGPQVMFLVMALVAVTVKHQAFAKIFDGHTTATWAATLSLTFFLHEFTQSRAAVAIGMCFMALVALLEGRRRAWGWWMFGAIGCHASTALFVPLSAALLARPSRRPLWLAAILAGLVAAILLGFNLLAELDLRFAEHAEVTGASIVPFVVGTAKLVVLVVLAHGVRRAPPTALARALMWPCVGFAACGLVMLLAFQSRSAGLAFRMYEFLDAFSVFVVGAALMQRRPSQVLPAIAYCALGIGLQILPKLFDEPYRIAPLASFLL